MNSWKMFFRHYLQVVPNLAVKRNIEKALVGLELGVGY